MNAQPGYTAIGAGDGNRTHVNSLEGCRTTIVLHPLSGGPQDGLHAGPAIRVPRLSSKARSSSGLGRSPFKADIAGSNPARATLQTIAVVRTPANLHPAPPNRALGELPKGPVIPVVGNDEIGTE